MYDPVLADPIGSLSAPHEGVASTAIIVVAHL